MAADKNWSHLKVKKPISLECHRSRLSAIKSKRISHRVSLGFEIEIKNSKKGWSPRNDVGSKILKTARV